MRINQKASATGPGLHRQTLGQPVWTRRDYAHLSDEAYVKNIIGFACVNKIATAVARLPLEVFKTEAKEEKLDNHEILDLLRRPNSKQSTKELIGDFVSFFKLSGNGYFEATVQNKKAVELHTLRSDRMKAVIDQFGEITSWKYKVGMFTHTFDQKNVTFFQDPIMHLRTFHPTDDVYGLSPVEPAAYSIDIHNQADKFNKSLLDNSAVPSGMFRWMGKDDDGNASTSGPDRFKRMLELVKSKFGGQANTGEVMVVNGNWEYSQLGLSIDDLQLIDTKRDVARDAAIAWGVPPMLLGIPGDNTYSNYQEANIAFHRDTVLPTATMVFEKISIFLFPSFGQFYLTFNTDKIEALATERSALWERVEKATFMTTNEKRNAVGLEDIEGGDVILVPAGMIPLDDAGLFIPGGPEPEEDEEAKEDNIFLIATKKGFK